MGLFFMSKAEKREEREICKCEHCDYILTPADADRPFCPQCRKRQSLEKRVAVLNYPPSEMRRYEIVKAKCPKCGCEDAFSFDCEYFYDITCSECGYDISSSTENKKLPPAPTIPVVECPYCHSKDTKKISSLSKAGSVALWGVFAAGKVSKQWHCNNCKSDF